MVAAGHQVRHSLAERKRARAVTLRTALRYTYQQIADAPLLCDLHRDLDRAPDGCRLCIPHMYSHRSTAQQVVTEALARDWSATEADRERLRSEQLATIDVLLSKMIADARTSVNPADRARAVNAAAKLLDRQAKLTGIDAPTRVTVDAELEAELEAAMAELAGLPMPTAEQLREQA